ncbi:MAG: hypothetical protein HZB39_15870 [Planctomycetes bacterium]|nr:hypothetical protein [Planctomycetota bacterium]
MNLCTDFASAVATFAIAILAPSTIAQTLRVDLATNRVAQGSSPGAAVTIGTVAYFTADDGIHGRELWRGDGSPSGTWLVADLLAGSGSSQPERLTVLGSTLLFTASDLNNGEELWRSDGTAAGTYLVADLTPGVASTSFWGVATSFTVLGGAILFAASDGVTNVELWRSDGTLGGTTLVKDIMSGPNGSYPAEITVMNGVAYFAASADTSGSELWRTNGTSAGTTLVADIASGSASSSPRFLLPWNGRLWFTANGTGGNELWGTDGTGAGTARVADIHPSGSASPATLIAAPQGLFFVADDGVHGRELWRSDGSAAGTTLVVDLSPGTRSSFAFVMTAAVVGNTLAFVADDGVAGSELWKSDGTAAGTVLLRDILPGATSSSPYGLIRSGTRLFFSAHDAVAGRELWVSDLSSAGTRLVADLAPGSESGAILGGTWHPAVDGSLWFAARDGTSASARGTELWRSDGTAAGTRLVADLNTTAPRAGSSIASGYREGPIVVNGAALFVADDGSGRHLWRSDGSAAGTYRLPESLGGPRIPSPRFLTRSGTRVFWIANAPSSGFELRVHDVITGATNLVRTFVPASSTEPRSLCAYQNALYFLADDGTSGAELWTSDGTTAGTRLVKDIRPGSTGSQPLEITAGVGQILFNADDGTGYGRRLWRSDGTSTGTVAVSGSAGETVQWPGGFLTWNGATYFSASVAGNPTRDVWVTNGISAGTRRISNLPSSTRGVGPLAATDVALFFAADDGVSGSELWHHHAGIALAQRVVDLDPRAGRGSTPSGLTPIGDRSYFRANDGISGYELWRVDGTSRAAPLVADVFPGPSSGVPENPAVGGGRLVFAGEDGTSGRELWTSDGTAAGTRRVFDLAYGRASSSPRAFFVLGNALFFAADDGVAGHELFDASLDRFGTGAATAVFGTGCPGTDGLIPTIEPTGMPTLGNAAFAITTWDVLPGLYRDVKERVHAHLRRARGSLQQLRRHPVAVGGHPRHAARLRGLRDADPDGPRAHRRRALCSVHDRRSRRRVAGRRGVLARAVAATRTVNPATHRRRAATRRTSTSVTAPPRITAPITANSIWLGISSIRLFALRSTCITVVPSSTPAMLASPPRRAQPPSTAPAMA